uniref:TRAF3-interacting protein 1 N-terminal domain-containing protein n=1 Tax=Amazona collaria TaxID=241587 RepID=A0A8B9FNX4_9PSIT
MNEAVVRRTQESLGRVIRKPPLTDRLLSKPPFRYLHDVITEVGRAPACGVDSALPGSVGPVWGCARRRE